MKRTDRPTDWEAIISDILSATDGIIDARWFIGDRVAATYAAYGTGAIKALAKDTGIEYQTLYGYYRAAKAFGPKLRKPLPAVFFSHYVVLARYVQDKKMRVKLLHKVSDEGWSVRKLGYKIGQYSKPAITKWKVCSKCKRRYKVGGKRREVKEE